MTDIRSVSVIIPNWNSNLIGEILALLRKQKTTATEVEVLVVGVDRPGLVPKDDSIRFIPTSQTKNGAENRNIGMEEAGGEVFLFLDHDCLPMPGWIEWHLQRQKQGHKVVGGAVTFDKKNYFQLADNVSAFHDLLPFTKQVARPYLATANMSVHREVVERVGKMNPYLKRAHDLEWTVRFRLNGFFLHFEPRALVLHDQPRCTFSSIWKHWVNDAQDTLYVRLLYQSQLNTPRLAAHRNIYLWGSPLVAAWATARAFAHHNTLINYWYTLPVVYLTKLAWCWGAYRNFPICSSKGAGWILPTSQR